MKTVAIAGLLAVLAIGGAFSAFAATRTIETSVDLELELWVDLQTSSAFVSTRQQGHEWITHDVRATLSQSPAVATLLVSDPVSLSVPVTVEVEVDAAPDELPFTPLAPATPHLAPGEAPSGRATCCRVRGMWDNPAAQRAVVAELRKVIAYAGTNLGLTHQGPITVNISHTPGGLLVRYEDAFEEALDELPSECSFQRGGHLFIGPGCRSDPEAIAREWVVHAVQAPYVSARWVGVATVEYYWALYQRGVPPSVRDDRYRSAIFHEPATDFRAGRAHEDLMGAAALYAVEAYGTFADWLAFYQDVRDGAAMHTAFAAAFGVSLQQLYADFEAWAGREQATMRALAYGSCREAARYIVPRSFTDGGGFPDFRVPLAFDGDGDGYVCEAYAGFADDDLVCVVAGEVSSAQ